MRAFSLIREAPHYRREAFASGLKAAGHEVSQREPDRYDRDTLLVIWNRYGHLHELALRVERGGGTVLVAENGYLGKNGVAPKFSVHPGGPKPDDYYSIAVGWNNGRGRWPNGGPERFAALGVAIKDWRTAGEHILIAPNRSFGVGEQVMSEDWADQAAARLKKQTTRPVVIRRHPGNDAPRRPLAADLERCWACVVWSSGVAVHSLLAGIPTYIEAPFQIMKGASATGPIDAPQVVDRLPHFVRMSWSQWRVDEIAEGLPFRKLFTS